MNGSDATIVGDAPAGGAAGGMEPDGVIEVRALFRDLTPQFLVLEMSSELCLFLLI